MTSINETLAAVGAAFDGCTADEAIALMDAIVVALAWPSFLAEVRQIHLGKLRLDADRQSGT